MDANEYQALALRTESTPDFIEPKFLDHREVLNNRTGGFELARLIHAQLGMCTEVGEFQDAVKKLLIYGKPIDRVNLLEEIGDVLWYCALAASACGSDLSEIMIKNIAKLKSRYPAKFTSDQALNRDLDAERKALER